MIHELIWQNVFSSQSFFRSNPWDPNKQAGKREQSNGSPKTGAFW
jgi:hypothetical protein